MDIYFLVQAGESNIIRHAEHFVFLFCSYIPFSSWVLKINEHIGHVLKIQKSIMHDFLAVLNNASALKTAVCPIAQVWQSL